MREMKEGTLRCNWIGIGSESEMLWSWLYGLRFTLWMGYGGKWYTA